MKLIHRLLILAVLVTSVGAQKSFVQLTAWAGMLVSYTSQKGLWEGVKDTFDGRHPCELCHLAQESDGGSEESGPPVRTETSLAQLKWIAAADESFSGVDYTTLSGQEIPMPSGRVFFLTHWQGEPLAPPSAHGGLTEDFPWR